MITNQEVVSILPRGIPMGHAPGSRRQDSLTTAADLIPRVQWPSLWPPSCTPPLWQEDGAQGYLGSSGCCRVRPSEALRTNEALAWTLENKEDVKDLR